VSGKLIRGDDGGCQPAVDQRSVDQKFDLKEPVTHHGDGQGNWQYSVKEKTFGQTNCLPDKRWDTV
jgi:hypothetical protein